MYEQSSFENRSIHSKRLSPHAEYIPPSPDTMGCSQFDLERADGLFAAAELSSAQNLSDLSAEQLRELADQREALERFSRSHHERSIRPSPPSTDSYQPPEGYNRHPLAQSSAGIRDTSSSLGSAYNQEIPTQSFSNMSVQHSTQIPQQLFCSDERYSPHIAQSRDHYQSIPHHYSPSPDKTQSSLAPSAYPYGYTSASASQSSLSPSSSSSISDEQLLAETLQFTHNSSPPYESIYPLSKPIAIPQVMKGITSPFNRAYAPALSNHGISPAEFMAFIDGLNVVSTGSPPLQALGMAGMAMGFAPSATAQIVGSVTELGAHVATAVVSSVRADKFITSANSDFFHSRKLHVAVVDTKALAQHTGMPVDAPTVAALDATTLNMSVLERRMAALKPYISELTTDVPQRTAQATRLQKMCDKQVAKQTARNEEKMRKNRLKALEKAPVSMAATLAGAQGPKSGKFAGKATKEQRKLDGEMDKIHRETQKKIDKHYRKGDVSKAQKEERKRNEELAKVEKERVKKNREASEKYEKKDKEVKEGKKGKWLLIRPWEEGMVDEQKSGLHKFMASMRS